MKQREHSPSLGIVNKSVLDATNLAYCTASKLASSGFIVKGISARRNSPTVWLVETGRCESLESCTSKIVRNNNGRYRIKVAIVDGCEIKWKKKEAA